MLLRCPPGYSSQERGLARVGLVGDALLVPRVALECCTSSSSPHRLGAVLVSVNLLFAAHKSMAADDDVASAGAASPAPVTRQTRFARRSKTESKSRTRDAGIVGISDSSVASLDAGSLAQPNSNIPDAGGQTTATAPPDAAIATMSSVGTAPSGSAPNATDSVNVEVRVRDTVVLTLHLSDGGMSAQERARRANHAIERALGVSSAKTVRVEQRENRSIVFIGEQPVVELTADDAAVAKEGSLDLYGASVAARISDILRAEEQRGQVARTVFSVVLSVLAAVLSLYLIRKLGDWTRRARNWVERNPHRIPAIRFKSIEVVRSPVLHGATLVAMAVAKWFAYFGTVYACVIFILSRFDSTHGYTDKLAGLVLSPLSTLTGRVATLLPLTAIVALCTVILLILLRFIGLFFAAVERGETHLEHLSPALAAPTSLIVRIGLVILAFLVVAPALTGNADGTFAKLGQLALAALALASVPLLTTVFLGIRILYASRLAVGQWVSIGNITGRVLALTLFETRIWMAGGVTARVPHLLLLWQPIRTASGVIHRLCLDVARTPELSGVLEAMTAAVASFGPESNVSIESVGATRASLVVQVTMPESKDKNALFFEMLRVLSEHGVALVDR